MVDCIRILFQIVGFTFLKVLNTVGTCPARLFAMLIKGKERSKRQNCGHSGKQTFIKADRF